MKILASLAFCIFGLNAHAHEDVTPELTGILKTEVTQHEAEDVCRDRGMRLPTARELALVSQSLGAEGISETKKDGYYLVKGKDRTGNPDHFYFSEKGYKRPAGELGDCWFWSSSVFEVFSGWKYMLNGYSGGFHIVMDTSYGNGDSPYAVRCVRSR